MSYPPVTHSFPAPRPPGISRALVFCVAVAAFIGGGLVSMAFNEVADLRPYVPPVFSPAATLACGDVDAYVRHVKDLNDHHVRTDTFGIHRQKTIDAVNELYDRARCNAHQDEYGHETYQTLNARTVVDSNDPPAAQAAPADPPRTIYPRFGELVPPASATAAPAAPKPAVTSRPRRRLVITGDGTLDRVQPPPPEPLQCGPDPVSHVDWHRRGCP